ncbi:hypothetical protein KAU40_02450, partial [Candidatus Parcubacteria bacterium]|nr:hypothetical protein [Candidatus Parcubacteria bacterium]
MLSNFFQFVKKHQEDIILLIGVILISLFSFAMGYITAKQSEKEPIKFENYESSYYWSRDLRIISC